MLGTMQRAAGQVLATAAVLAAMSVPSASNAAPLRLQAAGDPAELAAFKELLTAFKGVAPDVEV